MLSALHQLHNRLVLIAHFSSPFLRHAVVPDAVLLISICYLRFAPCVALRVRRRNEVDRQAYELSVLLPRPRQCVHAAQVDPHVVRDHLQRERGFLGLDEFRYRLRRCLHGLCPFDWERLFALNVFSSSQAARALSIHRWSTFQ